ncbi:MAG: aspartate aminotransferase family protein, partial [Gammaproteobacteria bacterium]|nr:aspartate aminotransferase family protein [Gammaproteobacteria bacterium]
MARDDSVRQLLEAAAQSGIDYRESSPSRAVAPTTEAVAAVDAFLEPMPAEGTADLSVLKQLDDIGTPATVTMIGPRYFGFVIGGSLPVTVASNWLATAWDQNVGMHEVTPATA